RLSGHEGGIKPEPLGGAWVAARARALEPAAGVRDRGRDARHVGDRRTDDRGEVSRARISATVIGSSGAAPGARAVVAGPQRERRPCRPPRTAAADTIPFVVGAQ